MPSPSTKSFHCGLSLAVFTAGFLLSNVCLAQLVISRESYLDKLKGGWVGQMVGVAWGKSTEFKYCGEMIPDTEYPAWTSGMMQDAFDQDDLYMELPFIRAMRDHGVLCGWRQYQGYLHDSDAPMWCANLNSWYNLSNGIEAPASGHYQNNMFSDSIDWQMEADFAGLICPGQEMAAVDIAWRAGHVVNYGDGVYGGAMVAAMHARAFFASSVDEIIEAGRQVIPVGSKYRQLVDDVVSWHENYPQDWTQTWRMLQEKWGRDDRDPAGAGQDMDVTAKLNGGYTLIGLLYGLGDFEQSMRIAMQAGQDSDCNPSTVGGVLGTWLGFSRLPERFVSALDQAKTFTDSQVRLEDLLQLSESLAREVLQTNGGSVSQVGSEETFFIESRPAAPLILEQWPVETSIAPVLFAGLIRSEGLKVQLQASSSEPQSVAYQWFFGDLTYTEGADVSHTYPSPGTYEAVCYATNSVGDTSWQMVPITVVENKMDEGCDQIGDSNTGSWFMGMGLMCLLIAWRSRTAGNRP